VLVCGSIDFRQEKCDLCKFLPEEQQSKCSLLNPRRTPRHLELEKEKLFISTAHWHISVKTPSSGGTLSLSIFFFPLFSVLICPTWIVIHSPPGCCDTLQNDRCQELSPRSASLSLLHAHVHNTDGVTHTTISKINPKNAPINFRSLRMNTHMQTVI